MQQALPRAAQGADRDGHGWVGPAMDEVRILPLMQNRAESGRREALLAVVLFAAALLAFILFQPKRAAAATRPWTLAMFALLAGGYLLLGVDAIRAWLIGGVARRWARLALGPAVLWIACASYAAVAGLAVASLAIAIGVYLAVPTLLLGWAGDDSPRRIPWRELLAAMYLGLAIKYHMLPRLPVPAPDGFDASRLVGVVAGLYLFLVGRPTNGVGYTWSVTARDLATAFVAFVAFAVIALPIGLGTHFLAWHPKPGWATNALQPIVIYLITGIPEEFLFRGLIQNFLMRFLGRGGGLVLASVIFGLSHYPDPRYMVLATFAGAAYGWVYLRTGKITASGVTHALVDAVWVVLLHR